MGSNLPVAEPPTHTGDTQPRRRVHRRRRRGCAPNLLVALVILLLIPAFLCGLSLVVYIVFPPPPLDLLIMGLDARAGEGALSRSDSIILVGVNPARLQVNLLSIPRDIFIDVPGYGSQRINTINFLGEQQQPGYGPQLLADSIAHNFGIDVDRYVRLDFAAFVELIDAVDGINLYVERVIVDDAYPTPDGGVISIRFESGWQTMDGERALIYARTRHGSDDYDRADRQQQVVSALVAKLKNPAYWPAAWDILSRHVDTDLTPWDMAVMAPPLLLNQGRFDQLVINRDYILGTAQGHAIPNYDKISPWIEGRFD